MSLALLDKEAIASSKRLLDIKPDKDDTSYRKGNKLLKLDRYEDTITNFEKTLDIQPNSYEDWYNRSIALLCLGRNEEAITSFDKTLELKQDNHEVWLIHGVLLWRLGHLEQALASFAQATQIKPDFPEAWIYQGAALCSMGCLEDAITSYNQALKIKPDFLEAWYNRGLTLLYLGRYQEALASFDQTIQVKSDFPEAWSLRGVALSNLRCQEDAIASYNQALVIKPDFPEAWYDRGNALSDLRRDEEAIASYDKAIGFKPDYYEAWYNRGNALRKLGRLEEAIVSFNKVIEFRPDSPEPWNNRGNVLRKLGRLEEALISFDKALEIKPDLQQAWYNKASCYALQGNVEQAIENLQQAINLAPDQWRDFAKNESDFDSIREDERFQALIQEESGWEERETDVEKDTIIQMQPLSPRSAKIDVKHLGIAKLEEGETKLFHNVSWEEFENLLTELGDNRSSRLAYNQGTLETRMPSQKHEYYKEVIRDLIKYLAEELDLDCESFGSTTWKRKDLLKGAEPDNCFYIQNEPAIRGIKPNIDLSKDPPPDLILEIDYTSPSLNRLSIYASLQVPEIWIYNMNVLCIYQLEAGKYKETDTSLAMGSFPIKEIPSFIEKNITASSREVRKSFRAWVRKYLKDTEEDVDTLDDSEAVVSLRASGKPFNAEEDKPTQAEILADIRRERSFDPAEFSLPDSLTLLREDRNR
ncbi:tetratricopeptide repeat protein [Microcoleus sp. FACHB-SPT15]|uniref:tetratricopeptide repeat protein n=1 Tax=Microcoleus sp. FACHB-SPT15 TaxID=2692830 RepID=UPI0017847ECE|nr:tetratricopeptide repeat protein [Microcoleus sp. FACHB-SPT15]MBD1805206.1 tetratricopeptide repeat protein [Microcoleus sp. FACHB-SPT15]